MGDYSYARNQSSNPASKWFGKDEEEIRLGIAAGKKPATKTAKPVVPRRNMQKPSAKKPAPDGSVPLTPEEQLTYNRLLRAQTAAGYPDRFPVSDENCSWNIPDASYAPPYVIESCVLQQDDTLVEDGWADPEDIGKRTRPFRSFVGQVRFGEDGLPLNPAGRTGIAGRGLLGRWGANFAADPIITRINPHTGVFEMAAIRRNDNGMWAIPGGMVDEGEEVSATIEREFEEEAGVKIDMSRAELVYRGFADGPRCTDNAWMETTAKHLHLDSETAAKLDLVAGDDAGDVQWMPVTEENVENLYANHNVLVKRAVELFLAKKPKGLSAKVRKTLEEVIEKD